ncbi:hypothetical protein ACNJUL_21125, partial [Mycobacterium tuberculosis]
EEAATKDLREDGPTIAEWVAAGYKARNYPPTGWASRSTAEEIEAAIAAEEAAAIEAAKQSGAAPKETATAPAGGVEKREG